jgi:hypothetical protein
MVRFLGKPIKVFIECGCGKLLFLPPPPPPKSMSIDILTHDVDRTTEQEENILLRKKQ